ncbi:hypothetical protein GGQ88_002375 [Novosphingobium hassiacum]|uniref:Uncharacterized protein n=1 Tax=Novosphingobium hassiacum TaxID=173676 RepID=A0A7W5ZXT8_9SPHN|nr:hypothetical protein [Novosphingobium hassiacum]
MIPGGGVCGLLGVTWRLERAIAESTIPSLLVVPGLTQDEAFYSPGAQKATLPRVKPGVTKCLFAQSRTELVGVYGRWRPEV